jgi:hypothetical protein
MWIGYMQILYHFISTWKSEDFVSMGEPGTNSPQIPRDDYIEFKIMMIINI